MADASDVTNALAALVSQSIYPNGLGQPSVIGTPVTVYPGWPDSATLDKDMQGLNKKPTPSGRLHVSVYPKNDEAPVSTWPVAWVPQTYSVPSIAFTINGNTVTLSGAPATPQNVALLVGNGNAAAPVTYALQPGDTLTSIATALAAQIQGATSSGAVITLPAATPAQSAVAGGSGTVMATLSRQKRSWMISVWANDWASRDALGKPLDLALRQVPFLLLPDTTSARLIYQASPYSDTRTSVQIYRRDFIYTATFDTTIAAPATQIVTAEMQIAPGVTGVSDAVATLSPIYQ